LGEMAALAAAKELWNERAIGRLRDWRGEPARRAPEALAGRYAPHVHM
jgi:hypothetical protein